MSFGGKPSTPSPKSKPKVDVKSESKPKPRLASSIASSVGDKSPRTKDVAVQDTEPSARSPIGPKAAPTAQKSPSGPISPSKGVVTDLSPSSPSSKEKQVKRRTRSSLGGAEETARGLDFSTPSPRLDEKKQVTRVDDKKVTKLDDKKQPAKTDMKKQPVKADDKKQPMRTEERKPFVTGKAESRSPTTKTPLGKPVEKASIFSAEKKPRIASPLSTPKGKAGSENVNLGSRGFANSQSPISKASVLTSTNTPAESDDGPAVVSSSPHSDSGKQNSVVDEDMWICRECGWTYPNAHPSAKHRRNHKKHCAEIKIKKSEGVHVNGGSSDEASSDDEGPAVTGTIVDTVVTPVERNSIAKSIDSSKVQATVTNGGAMVIDAAFPSDDALNGAPSDSQLLDEESQASPSVKARVEEMERKCSSLSGGIGSPGIYGSPSKKFSILRDSPHSSPVKKFLLPEASMPFLVPLESAIHDDTRHHTMLTPSSAGVDHELPSIDLNEAASQGIAGNLKATAVQEAAAEDLGVATSRISQSGNGGNKRNRSEGLEIECQDQEFNVAEAQHQAAPVEGRDGNGQQVVLPQDSQVLHTVQDVKPEEDMFEEHQPAEHTKLLATSVFHPEVEPSQLTPDDFTVSNHDHAISLSRGHVEDADEPLANIHVISQVSHTHVDALPKYNHPDSHELPVTGDPHGNAGQGEQGGSIDSLPKCTDPESHELPVTGGPDGNAGHGEQGGSIDAFPKYRYPESHELPVTGDPHGNAGHGEQGGSIDSLPKSTDPESHEVPVTGGPNGNAGHGEQGGGSIDALPIYGHPESYELPVTGYPDGNAGHGEQGGSIDALPMYSHPESHELPVTGYPDGNEGHVEQGGSISPTPAVLEEENVTSDAEVLYRPVGDADGSIADPELKIHKDIQSLDNRNMGSSLEVAKDSHFDAFEILVPSQILLGDEKNSEVLPTDHDGSGRTEAVPAAEVVSPTRAPAAAAFSRAPYSVDSNVSEVGTEDPVGMEADTAATEDEVVYALETPVAAQNSGRAEVSQFNVDAAGKEFALARGEDSLDGVSPAEGPGGAGGPQGSIEESAGIEQLSVNNESLRAAVSAAEDQNCVRALDVKAEAQDSLAAAESEHFNGTEVVSASVHDSFTSKVALAESEPFVEGDRSFAFESPEVASRRVTFADDAKTAGGTGASYQEGTDASSSAWGLSHSTNPVAESGESLELLNGTPEQDIPSPGQKIERPADSAQVVSEASVPEQKNSSSSENSVIQVSSVVPAESIEDSDEPVNGESTVGNALHETSEPAKEPEDPSSVKVSGLVKKVEPALSTASAVAIPRSGRESREKELWERLLDHDVKQNATSPTRFFSSEETWKPEFEEKLLQNSSLLNADVPEDTLSYRGEENQRTSSGTHINEVPEADRQFDASLSLSKVDAGIQSSDVASKELPRDSEQGAGGDSVPEHFTVTQQENAGEVENGFLLRLEEFPSGSKGPEAPQEDCSSEPATKDSGNQILSGLSLLKQGASPILVEADANDSSSKSEVNIDNGVKTVEKQHHHRLKNLLEEEHQAEQPSVTPATETKATASPRTSPFLKRIIERVRSSPPSASPKDVSEESSVSQDVVARRSIFSCQCFSPVKSN